MEVFQKAGEYHGWYGAEGWIGGEDADAWMFACYYSEDIKGEADIPSEDNGSSDNGAADNNSGANQGNTSAPVTGDNVIVIVAVAAVALVAIVAILFIRRRKAN